MPRIFLSHDSRSRREAVTFKDLLMRDESEIEVFLSSDWDSIEAGRPWLEAILASLRSCDTFIAMIANTVESANPWIHFEVGYVMARDQKPKVFVFGGVDWQHIPFPLKAVHLIDTGDTNRCVTELERIGVSSVRKKLDAFARLFRQNRD
jgi:TIR domain